MTFAKVFITTVQFGAKKVELSYGTKALFWLETEAEQRTGKPSSFMAEIDSLRAMAENGAKDFSLKSLARLIRAGHAHYSEIPTQEQVFELLDELAGEDAGPDDGDTLMTMISKIAAAMAGGVPGIGRKKQQPAPIAPTAETKTEANSDGADPTAAPSTGTAS